MFYASTQNPVHQPLEVSINGFRTNYPGKMENWCGYECNHFELEGVSCYLIHPKVVPASEKFWYWRARFFGAFPQGDFAMLEKGWFVAHIEINELYGSPKSRFRFNLLYDFLTSLGFNRRPVLVGYSRGGLDVYNWAAENPDKVCCLYLDNAVCDFKSWPGGCGGVPRAAKEWQNCLESWGFTEEEALAYDKNPVDNLVVLAKHRVPILHLCGDEDEVVPPVENTLRVEQRYRELGGEIEVIHKPGAKHHPHCLTNPDPIVDFILKHL